jgi:hypothetical protein
MESFFSGLFRRFLIKIGVIGVFFLVLSPIGFFTERPQDDVRYYLLKPPLVELQPDEVPRRNSFVRVSGLIELASFQIHKQGWLSDQLDFKFRLEGYPKSLLVCLEEGPLYDELKAAYFADSKPPAGAAEPPLEVQIQRSMMNRARTGMSGAIEVKSGWTRMAAILGRHQVIEGRLHGSDSSPMSPFPSFVRERETRIPDYVEQVLHLHPDQTDLWLIDAGETPDPARFFDSNAVVFLFGCTLGILALGWFLHSRRRRKRPTPPPLPPGYPRQRSGVPPQPWRGA